MARWVHLYCAPAMPNAIWQPQELKDDPHHRADKAAKVQAMFSAIAKAYDLNNRVHSFGLDQRWRRHAVRAAAVKPTDDVLDVACGTGDLTELFANARSRSVVGVDFTAAMLDIARVKQARHAQYSSIRYEQGDAMALAVESSSVDIVSIAFGLRNVSDPVQALAEFRRVLRPGGRLVVLEFDEPTNAIIRAANRLYTHHIMPWTASLLARDRSGAYRYLPRSVETFLSRDRLRDAMLAAGFSHVKQTPLTFGTCVLSCGRVNTSA